MNFRVNGYPDQEFTGKVRRVNPAANATTRQVEVLVDFTGQKQPRLAGLYAEGHVETSNATQPHPSRHRARARRRQGLGLAREGRQAAEGRRSRIGERDPRTGDFVLKGGLAEGDQVIRYPSALLKDGQLVQASAPVAPTRPPPRATRRPRQGTSAMFLSDFSIKRPVSTVVVIIGLMCLGLLALKNLRVNQIPDVEQPVIVVNIPYPGASPETVEREIINRVEKALQSIPQVYQIRSHRRGKHGHHRHHLQLQEEHGGGLRRDPERHRLGAPQAAGGDARADPAAHRPFRAAHHAAGALLDRPRRTPRSRAWPRTCSPTGSARSTAWPW